MSPTALSIFLAFIGYSILNISHAVQKIGFTTRTARPVLGGAIWTGGLIASGASFGVVFAAIALGRVSVVGAMAGTGLVSLSVFSRVVMAEDLNRQKLPAVALIVIGASLVALFPTGSEETLRPILPWVIPGAVIIVGTVAIAFTHEGAPRGIAIGAISGFLGAYSQLFQKQVANTLFAGGNVSFGRLFHEPVNFVWIMFSVASMVVLQFAYRHAEAVRIVPAFTAAFIVTPVIGGVILYSEVLSWLQWCGVPVIVAGASRLTV